MQHKHYPAGLLAVVTLLAGPVESQTAYMNVKISDGLLTLKAENVTVRQLVEAIAQKSGIRLVLHNPLDERVNLAFDRVLVSQAITRLLHSEDYALQCAQPHCLSARQEDGAQNILWVFSDEAGYYQVSTSENEEIKANRALDRDKVLQVEAITAALDDRNASVREEAVDTINDLEGETAISFLEYALGDPNVAVREAAIAALVDIGGDEAARALAAVLNDENASLREDAVDALGDIGGTIAAQLLQQALEDEKNFIREAAAEILADQIEHR